MNTVSLINPLEDKRWDSFVENHPMGWISHLSSWKRMLEKSFPYIKGYCLILSEHNLIRAGLPLYEVSNLLLGSRLVSVPFATLFDPLVSNENDLNLLLNGALDIFKERKCRTFELRTLNTYSLMDKLKDNIYTKCYFKHHYIELNGNLENIRKSFDRTCVRQRINRAMNSDLHVKVCHDKLDLKSFYHLYTQSRKRKGLPPIPFKFFDSIWETFYPTNKISLSLVLHQGTPISSLLLFKFNNRVSAEVATSDDSYKQFSANHLLFWKAIEMAHNEGYRLFDFGRTSPDNISLINFKKRWGTKETDFPVYYYPQNNSYSKRIKELYWFQKQLNNVLRILPISVFNGIGKFLYHYNII